MGMEPAFHLDSLALNYAFIPCGHIASEKTVKYIRVIFYALFFAFGDFYANFVQVLGSHSVASRH